MEQTQKKKTAKPYSPEFRERAVRLAMEHRDEYQSEAAALTTIASKLGCSPDSLRVWMRQVQRDGGERPGPTSAEIARIKELERENREPRTAAGQRDFEEGVSVFCSGGARPPFPQMTAFIEEHREMYGVEPICRTLQFAPSTYSDRRAIARDPHRASTRAKSDAALSVKIDAVWDANRKLYGARKIWHVLRRQGEDTARCTVERLMRNLGIKGVVRSKKGHHYEPGHVSAVPGTQGEPSVDDGSTEQTVGFRFYLRAHIVGNSLCGVRDRCVCTTDRGVARLDIDEDPVRA
jgi:putative transposase